MGPFPFLQEVAAGFRAKLCPPYGKESDIGGSARDAAPGAHNRGVGFRRNGAGGALPGDGIAACVARVFGVSTELCPASVYMIAKPGGYSIDKARRLLGYEPRVTFDEGMRRTEAWLRENGYLP